MNKNIKAINLVWLSRTGLTNMNSGEGGSNFVDIKKYRFQGREYPYVSGQAMRFYLKEAIRRNIAPEEACVADQAGETCGLIDSCILCDLFGFMATIPDVGAKTRVSPVKVSPAIGLLPFDDNSVVDFLTRRHRVAEGERMEGDIVNVELGMNLYKAGVSIDVAKIGAEERDFVIQKIKEKPIHGIKLEQLINDNERQHRIQLLLTAIRTFSDYSKQARLLTDFTPDFILVSVQGHYSHRLQKGIELEDGMRLNVNRLKEVIGELSENGCTIYAGSLDGIVENQDEVLSILSDAKITVQKPAEVINQLIELV